MPRQSGNSPRRSRSALRRRARRRDLEKEREAERRACAKKRRGR
ncbi:MAG: hypothetical protein U0P45_17205 [Acidimicrobiales bacterium]